MKKNSSNNIVPISLIKYDEMTLKYNKDFLKSNVDFIKNNDPLKRNKIIIKKNSKQVIKGEYEVLGYFDRTHKIWIWGWAIPHLEKCENQLIRNLLNYGLDIDNKIHPTDNSDEIKFYLKTQLITSRFRINNFEQIEIFLALSMYLTKQSIIYPHRFQNITVYYFVIK